MYNHGTGQVRSGVSGDRSPRRARVLRGYVYRIRIPKRQGRPDRSASHDLGARGLGEQRAGAKDQLV